jgi:hypothetical protein
MSLAVMLPASLVGGDLLFELVLGLFVMSTKPDKAYALSVSTQLRPL